MLQRRLRTGRTLVHDQKWTSRTLMLSLSFTMVWAVQPWCTTRSGPGVVHAGDARAVPFGRGGPLKMLYDNRMHPQAIEFDGSVYLTWRGSKGMPYIRSYDLDSRQFSEPVMMLAGMEDKIDAEKYASDHHYSPVIWMDAENRFHILSGCHGNKPSKFTGGNRIRSKRPGDITEWEWVDSEINVSVNYPKPYRT